MPVTPHLERHFTAEETVRDIVIGMSDGSTVPFTLAAGISGAVSSTGIVVTAGLARIVAGSIAMGLGGYMAARTDAEHFKVEYERELGETRDLPDKGKQEVFKVLRDFGSTSSQIYPVLDQHSRNRQKWVDFVMRF